MTSETFYHKNMKLRKVILIAIKDEVVLVHLCEERSSSLSGGTLNESMNPCSAQHDHKPDNFLQSNGKCNLI